MSLLLSLVTVLSFSAGEVIASPEPFLELAAPQGEELPANAQLFFRGSFETQSSWFVDVTVNESAARSLPSGAYTLEDFMSAFFDYFQANLSSTIQNEVEDILQHHGFSP